MSRKPKRILWPAIIVSFIVLTVIALVSARTKEISNLRSAALAQNQPQRVTTDVPDHVLYRILFHDVFLRKQKALKAENEGKPGIASAWRNTYKRDALMSDDHATILEQIAEQCELEVAQQDARARIVIERDKARYPGGKVSPGETLQPPSPELFEMQKERNAIILRFRDHLHDAFGEVEFSRFQDFLKRKLAPQITSTPSAAQGAESR